MLIDLDIHELWYLLDSALRGSHLRSGIIERFTNEIYNKLDEHERMNLFESAVRLGYAWDKDNCHFEPYFNCCGKDTEFMKRYHPLNQYIVTTKYKGKVQNHRAFKMNGEYHITSTTTIDSEYITKVEQIDLSKEWEEHKTDNVDYDTNIIE